MNLNVRTSLSPRNGGGGDRKRHAVRRGWPFSRLCRCRAATRRVVVCALTGVAVWLALQGTGNAQVSGSGGAKVNSRELINYLYTSVIENGVYEVGDESALRLQVKMKWIPYKVNDDQDWGVHLELPVSVGVHALKILDEIAVDEDFRLKTEHIGIVELKPTVRLPMRYHPGWIITPWQQIAAGTDVNDIKVLWTSTTGLDSQFLFDDVGLLKEVALIFKYGTYISDTGLSDDDYFLTSIRATVLRPFGRIKKYKPQARVVARVGYYWDSLTFDESDGSTIEVREEYEIGIEFETQPRARILGIGLPKPGIYVRFGDDLTAIKIKL